MNAIQLTLDQKLYKADKDEIKEFTICELVSYDDGKLGVMLIPGKDRHVVEKTAQSISGRYFFTQEEAVKHQKKVRDALVNRAISALIKSGKNCFDVLQKYGKKQA